jgi:hypothetical protein
MIVAMTFMLLPGCIVILSRVPVKINGIINESASVLLITWRREIVLFIVFFGKFILF